MKFRRRVTYLLLALALLVLVVADESAPAPSSEDALDIPPEEPKPDRTSLAIAFPTGLTIPIDLALTAQHARVSLKHTSSSKSSTHRGTRTCIESLEERRRRGSSPTSWDGAAM